MYIMPNRASVISVNASQKRMKIQKSDAIWMTRLASSKMKKFIPKRVYHITQSQLIMHAKFGFYQ